MYFRESSHKARWLYTEEELARLRQELHASQVAIQSSEQHQDKRHEAQLAGSSTPPGAHSTSLPVTVKEVQLLLRYYESKVAAICKETRLPKKVQATALVYFKRYHLRVGILSSDPIRVLLTSIYLAAKIEESYISAEELCKALQQKPTVVLKEEVGLLTSLGFDLVIHSPFRALAGLLTDIEDLRSQSGQQSNQDVNSQCDPELLAATPATIKAIRGRAESALDALMLTDAPLLHEPCVLALAALRTACRNSGIKLMHYLPHAVLTAQAHQQEAGDVEKLSASLAALLDKVDSLGIAGSQKVDQAEVQEIDRKIKQWKANHPMNDPAANTAKQEAEAKQKAERREQKLKARKEAAKAEEDRLLGIAQ